MNKKRSATANASFFLCIVFLIINAAWAVPSLTPGVWKNLGVSMSGYGATFVRVDHNHPDTVYATVDQSGLWRSTNRGDSWTRVGTSGGADYDDSVTFLDSPLRVYVDPNNPRHIYASQGVRGTTLGFWVSNDYGAHWVRARKTDGSTMSNSDLSGLCPDPTNFNHVLTASHWNAEPGYYESTNGGVSFREITHPSGWGGGSQTFEFLYHPASNTGDANTWLAGSPAGFWRTSDAGATWTKVSSSAAMHNGGFINYAPNGNLYVASDIVLKSTDNGKTFVSSSGLPSRSYYDVGCDGNFLYANISLGWSESPRPFYVTPVTDGVHWTQYQNGTQTFNDGPTKYDFDETNRILYASCWGAGVWALKVLGNGVKTTAPVKQAAASQQIPKGVRLIINGGNGLVALSDNSANRIFDITGRQLNQRFQKSIGSASFRIVDNRSKKTDESPEKILSRIAHTSKGQGMKIRTFSVTMIFLCFMINLSLGADFKATCTIDRSKIFPKVPYQEITLRLPIGDATSAEVLVDGQAVVSRIDQSKKMLIFTTSGSSVEARVYGVSSQSQIGTFKKAVLRDDKKWAWSHGYDDNTGYHLYGTEVFNQYGWTGTLFLIGNMIMNDSGVTWRAMAPDFRRLHKQGWAIGNHGFGHDNCPNGCSDSYMLDQIVKNQDTIKHVLASVDPAYTPIAFASPAFTHAYDNVVKDIRNNHPEIGIMYVEGQGENANSAWRMDSGATEASWRWVWAADSNKTIPRATNLYEWTTADGAGSSVRTVIDSIVRFADETHHYWWNSLEHGVDQVITNGNMAACTKDVFGFVPYIYNHYGPGGDNSVWVAPSEKIYSYYITRLTAKLSSTTVAPVSATVISTVMAHGARLIRPTYAKTISQHVLINNKDVIFDMHGRELRSGCIPAWGVCIVKR